MSREAHVPFYEGLGVQFPRPTHRYCMSFRDVEDLLAERGIIVSYETVRLNPEIIYRTMGSNDQPPQLPCIGASGLPTEAAGILPFELQACLYMGRTRRHNTSAPAVSTAQKTKTSGSTKADCALCWGSRLS